MELDEQTRYAFFKNSEGKCAHCNTRLFWEEFDVRGRSGGWVLEIREPEDGEMEGKALCFRCNELPSRRKSGRLYTRAGFSAAPAAHAPEGDDDTPVAPDAEVEET